MLSGSRTLRILLAIVALGCTRREPPAPPLRLIAQAEGSRSRTMTIDGMRRRVLDPSRPEHVFPVRLAAGRRVLVFAIGLDRTPPDGAAVHYEILIRDARQHARRLYARELRDPQWVTDQVEIPGTLADGADLVLRA